MQACGDLAVCNKTELVLLADASNSEDLNCQLCEYVMSMVKEQLDDPETEADLLAQAAQVAVLSLAKLQAVASSFHISLNLARQTTTDRSMTVY